MNELLSTWLERFDRLSLRERALIALVAGALVWMLWSQSLDKWLTTAVSTQRAEIAALSSQRDAARDTLRHLEQSLAQELRPGLAQDHERLLDQRERLHARLDTHLQQFVTPEQMRTVLEDLLAHHGGVSLVALTSIAPEPLNLTGPDVSETDVYRHAVKLELTGSYAALTAYLAAIEARPWQFLWQSLEYEVKDHPRGTMRVVVSTLSRDRYSLGV